MAIRWFHESPDQALYGSMDPRDLKDTSIGGYLNKGYHDRRVTEVSRIWNRMLPCVSEPSFQKWQAQPGSGLDEETTSIAPWPGSYLEVLVLFSDRHTMDPDPTHQIDLINCLNEPGSPFKRITF